MVDTHEASETYYRAGKGFDIEVTAVLPGPDGSYTRKTLRSLGLDSDYKDRGPVVKLQWWDSLGFHRTTGVLASGISTEGCPVLPEIIHLNDTQYRISASRASSW